MRAALARARPFVVAHWHAIRSGLRLVLVLVLLAFGYANLPALTDGIADTVFGNALPATNLEPAAMVELPRWSVDEWSALVGRGEGLDCSIPPAALAAFTKTRGTASLASINLWFRQACVAHDYCYRHGRATYGYSQAQCDTALVEASFRVCHQIVTDASVAWCAAQARKVLSGVTFGGFNSFRPAFDDPVATPRKATDIQGVSIIAEYDAYPSGNATYSVPRLVRGACLGRSNVPILVDFMRRPGGSKVRSRCFDGHGFVDPGPGFAATIGSEYAYRISPPWISDASSPAGLLQWCRNYSLRDTTGGRFQRQDPGSFKGCSVGGPQPAPDEQDPDVITPFPVPGPLAEQIPAFGLTKNSLTYFRLPSGPLRPIKAPDDPRTLCHDTAGNQVRCAITLPDICAGASTGDHYRWFATAPVALENSMSPPAPDGPRVEVTIFARGCGTSRDYQTLTSRSAMLGAAGFAHAPGKSPQFNEALFWDIPETAEPLAPLGDGRGLAALLSVHAVKQPNVACRLWWSGLLHMAATMALVAAAFLMLGLTRRDIIAGLIFAAFGSLSLIVAAGLTHSLSADGFSQDAEIAVYFPGSTAHQAPSAKTVQFAGGRPWLQQRTSILRDKEDYLVLMPRFLSEDCIANACLNLKISRVSLSKGPSIAYKSTIELPDWASSKNLAGLRTVPFRDEHGDLALVVLGPGDKHAVFKLQEKGQGAFQLSPA